MKNNLRILSIIAFIISIPSMIVTNWFCEYLGIFEMFAFVTIGLVLDQMIRLKYPAFDVEPVRHYQFNRILNIIALILLVQSPMGLIFGNRCIPNMGFCIMAIMVCCGIAANQIARIRFPYRKK